MTTSRAVIGTLDPKRTTSPCSARLSRAIRRTMRASISTADGCDGSDGGGRRRDPRYLLYAGAEGAAVVDAEAWGGRKEGSDGVAPRGPRSLWDPPRKI